MSETYIAKPIELSVINELKVVVEKYKKALKAGLSFREVSLAQRNLQQKLSKLLDCRNKSVEDAIPPEDFDKALVIVSSTGCNCEFHVQLDAQIESLIDEALKLSSKLYDSYIVYK